MPFYLQPFGYQSKRQRQFRTGLILTLVGILVPPLLVVGIVLLILSRRPSEEDEANRPFMAFDRAVECYRNGDWAGCRQALAEALPAAADHPRITALDGMAAYAIEEYAAATERLASLPASLVEGEPDLLRAAAYSYFYISDFEHALPLLQRLWREEPDNLEHLKAVGICLMSMGNYPAAVEALSQAPLRRRSPDPSLTEIRYYLGRCYLEMGNKARAKTYLQRVYAEDSQYRDVAEMLAQCSKRG